MSDVPSSPPAYSASPDIPPTPPAEIIVPNHPSSDTLAPLTPTSPHGSVSTATASPRSSNARRISATSPSSGARTSTRTRDRLRQVELEREILLRELDGERALAERLKREAASAELSAGDAERRITQLKEEIQVASAKTSWRPTAGLFKAAFSSDVLFLIDTTSSMRPHIDAAKSQVKSIAADLVKAFLGEAEIRMAVVGYKDHSDWPSNQYLDFTTHIDQVRAFLDGLRATGGADAPEDVLGGFKQALNMSWKHQTKCIIHIADAPAHGNTLHDFPRSGDTYYYPGTEPHKLTYEPLIRQAIGLKVNYALLRINNSTDRMSYTFMKQYFETGGNPECKLHTSNKYYSDGCNLTEAASRTLTREDGSLNPGQKSCVQSDGPVFEEMQLGTTFTALQHLVVGVVTASASRTAIAVVVRTGAGTATNLGSITENESTDRRGGSGRLDTSPPRWDDADFLDETLIVEGFTPDAAVGGTVLDEMICHDDNIKMKVAELTLRVRSRPFAEGAMRTTSYAKTAASDNLFVIKSYKRGGKKLAHVAEDMRCQALCKAFAFEFNALSGERRYFDFLTNTCLKGKKGEECMTLEHYIRGSYVKYNGNNGYVKKDNGPNDRLNKMAQAFSHFTFERSRGKMLVSDLQGVGTVLTDPAVQTLDPERFKLSETNLGSEGFKCFFVTHVCNEICTRLGLKSNKSMAASGLWQFRESWPVSNMGELACCSNRLCAMNLSRSTATASDKFPGYLWCRRCYPQLASSVVRRVCVETGVATHEFDVSKFFYESQGQRPPRKCPTHSRGGSRAPAPTSTSLPAIAGRFSSKVAKTLAGSSPPKPLASEASPSLGTAAAAAAAVVVSVPAPAPVAVPPPPSSVAAAAPPPPRSSVAPVPQAPMPRAAPAPASLPRSPTAPESMPKVATAPAPTPRIAAVPASPPPPLPMSRDPPVTLPRVTTVPAPLPRVATTPASMPRTRTTPSASPPAPRSTPRPRIPSHPVAPAPTARVEPARATAAGTTVGDIWPKLKHATRQKSISAFSSMFRRRSDRR